MFIFQANGIRSLRFDLHDTAIGQLRANWQQELTGLGHYPKLFEGKGIVMCGGGVRYFTCAWVAVKMIRKTGCGLPIEIWHTRSEMMPAFDEHLNEHNVTVKNINDFTKEDVHGYLLKALAILHSSFKEIIYIDSDNIALANPEALFSDIGYMETGALFWPDYWRTAKDNPIWKIIGQRPNNGQEQESGQLVINKERCWEALNLTVYFNRQHGVYYKLLLGDKDTFRFSWLALSMKFSMIAGEPAPCGKIDKFTGKFMGNTMLQHNRLAQPIFLHRNLLKWDITREDELAWNNRKQFLPEAVAKSYVLEYCHHNLETYVDILGDVETSDCKAEFGGIEEECLAHLSWLRRQNFYTKLLVENYIAFNRR